MFVDKDKVVVMLVVVDVVDEWLLVSLDCFCGDIVENFVSVLVEMLLIVFSIYYESVEVVLDVMLLKLDKSILLIVFGLFIIVVVVINYFKE